MLKISDNNHILQQQQRTENFMQQDKPATSMSSVILSDIFFLAPFSIIAAFGIVALAVLSIFIGVCGLVFIVKSFYFDTSLQIVGGLAVSIMALSVTALFGYIEFLISRSTYRGIKKYLKERKQSVAIIKKSQQILQDKENAQINNDTTQEQDASEQQHTAEQQNAKQLAAEKQNAKQPESDIHTNQKMPPSDAENRDK